jgi:hypothetical protein
MDPTEAAHNFLRLLNSTKKEFKILQNANNKLTNQHSEIKEQLAEVKKEARENV